MLRPTATAEFWERGFGQTLVGSNRKLTYRMQRGRTEGTYQGTAPLRLGLRFPPDMVPIPDRVLVNGRPVEMVREQDLIFLVLPAASPQEPCRFEVACGPVPNSATDQDHAIGSLWPSMSSSMLSNRISTLTSAGSIREWRPFPAQGARAGLRWS